MVKNIIASVRGQLKNYSIETGQEFQKVLTYFVYDRFLHRLSQSRYSGYFILKGGMLLRVWFDHPYRYTQDIDFEWFGEPYKHNVENVLKEIMSLEMNDGLNFNPDQLKIQPDLVIRGEDAKKVLRFANFVNLGNSRIKLNIDIGYGEKTELPFDTAEFPSILPSEQTKIQVYPKEKVIAEKFHAMCSHGKHPSRLKDLFDVWYLTKEFKIDPTKLTKTIQSVFKQRQDVSIPEEVPIILTESFANSQSGQALWTKYKKKIYSAKPLDFAEIRADLRMFPYELC